MEAERLTTSGVAAHRQYDRWRAAVGSTHGAWDMRARREGAFRGEIHRRGLGQAQLIACASDPCAGRRGPAELGAASSQAGLGVLFILDGREKLSHARGDVFLHAGQFTVWDTTRPIAFEVPSPLRKLTLMLPAAALGPSLARAEDAVGRSFDARGGCGALLSAQLHALMTLPTELDPVSQQSVVRALAELFVAALGSSAGGLSPASARIIARAEAHIMAELHDPELTVEATARALGLSRRRLDRAFAEGGRQVGRFIWSERLSRCRRDLLLEPKASVSEIAFRWGFSSASHFSRAFRAAYGTSPSQQRSSLSGPGV